MQKILLVTRNFPPLVGGMERLNRHMADQLRQGFRVGLCGPKGCERFALPGTVTATFPTAPLWRFTLACFIKSAFSSLRFKPDVVIAGSGATAPFGLLAARLAGASFLMYAHGLDLIVENRFYKRFFVPCIRLADVVLVNSRNTAKLAKGIGVAPQRIRILNPGVEIPASASGPTPGLFRKAIGAGDRPILLSVGRLTRRKGLHEFIENSMPKILEKCPKALLVIIGGDPTHALAHKSGHLAELKNLAERLGMDNHIHFHGQVGDEALKNAYTDAQVHVFPVLDLPGDVEGFGMVALEAAAHGMPTVAFAAGGVPDAVSQGISGWLVAPGDYDAMASYTIDHLQNGNTIDMRDACKSFATGFEWPRFGERLRRICYTELSKDENAKIQR